MLKYFLHRSIKLHLLKYYEYLILTKSVPCAATLWSSKNKVCYFSHWSRWIYLHFNNSLLTWNVVQIVIYKYCLYNPLLNRTESSKCTIVVLVPRRSVHVNPVHWSIHTHWHDAVAHSDKPPQVSTSVVTIGSFILIFPFPWCLLKSATLWLLFIVFFELNKLQKGSDHNLMWITLAPWNVN